LPRSTGIEYPVSPKWFLSQHDAAHSAFDQQKLGRTVVGADGMHSNVRRLVFGPESQFVRDLGAYVAIFTTRTHPDLDGWELMYGIPAKNGGKTAALYPLPNTAEAIAMFFFAAPPLPYDRQKIEQQKQFVAQAFAGAGWEVPRMLAAMCDAPDFYFDRACQIQMDRWWRGRVALLGDAGYCGSPLGGNGTSMALVGAYVLAGELAAVRGDHRTAFARYETELREYVRRCQRFAQGSADFSSRSHAHSSGWSTRPPAYCPICRGKG
jgi:2-polyprenyl-6-methoxyphenol hydroxylase-like FAD-dependent oxidoreductase